MHPRGRAVPIDGFRVAALRVENLSAPEIRGAERERRDARSHRDDFVELGQRLRRRAACAYAREACPNERVVRCELMRASQRSRGARGISDPSLPDDVTKIQR